MTPHVCPKCNGSRLMRSSLGTLLQPSRPCPTCAGTGVVWAGDERGCDPMRLRPREPIATVSQYGGLRIDGQPHKVNKTSMTGIEIKALSGKDATRQLFRERKGSDPDQLVGDCETIQFELDDHFYTIPPVIFGSMLTRAETAERERDEETHRANKRQFERDTVLAHMKTTKRDLADAWETIARAEGELADARRVILHFASAAHAPFPDFALNAIEGARSALKSDAKYTENAFSPVDCVINSLASRTCERGTKCCIVTHNGNGLWNLGGNK